MTALIDRVSTKQAPPVLVISSAIVLPDKRLFVGRTVEDCYNLAHLFLTPAEIKGSEERFLTSEGLFVTPEEAAKVALLVRQISKYVRELKSENIF